MTKRKHYVLCTVSVDTNSLLACIVLAWAYLFRDASCQITFVLKAWLQTKPSAECTNPGNPIITLSLLKLSWICFTGGAGVQQTAEQPTRVLRGLGFSRSPAGHQPNIGHSCPMRG